MTRDRRDLAVGNGSGEEEDEKNGTTCDNGFVAWSFAIVLVELTKILSTVW